MSKIGLTSETLRTRLGGGVDGEAGEGEEVGDGGDADVEWWADANGGDRGAGTATGAAG